MADPTQPVTDATGAAGQSVPIPELRDIVVPDSVTAYWLAPGWGLVLLIVVVGVLAFAVLWRRQRRKSAYRRQAVAELEHWLQRQEPHAGLQTSQLAYLSSLLKRVALHSVNRKQLAACYGLAWQQYLDNAAPGRLSTEALQLITWGEYQASVHSELSLQQLVDQCKRWIHQHRPYQPEAEALHAAI